jgi:hypothetical protein
MKGKKHVDVLHFNENTLLNVNFTVYHSEHSHVSVHLAQFVISTNNMPGA